jgi:hypothetical protein
VNPPKECGQCLKIDRKRLQVTASKPSAAR